MQITENALEISFEGFRLEAFKDEPQCSLLWVQYGDFTRVGRFDKLQSFGAGNPHEILEPSPKGGDSGEKRKKSSLRKWYWEREPNGPKVTYSTDTPSYCKASVEARERICWILEGMYGRPDSSWPKPQRALTHDKIYERQDPQKKWGAPKLWLQHYSPSMTRPEEFMDDVRKIFPAAYAAKDGWTMELNFDEGK